MMNWESLPVRQKFGAVNEGAENVIETSCVSSKNPLVIHCSPPQPNLSITPHSWDMMDDRAAGIMGYFYLPVKAVIFSELTWFETTAVWFHLALTLPEVTSGMKHDFLNVWDIKGLTMIFLRASHSTCSPYLVICLCRVVKHLTFLTLCG